MQLIRNKYVYILIFVVMFVASRFLYLGYDEINPDSVNWHERSQQFYVGLKALDLEKTYQHYHPGVTLMWLGGFVIELLKQVYPGAQFYNHENFLVFHTAVKYAVVSVQLFLTLLVWVVLYRVLKSFSTIPAFVISTLTVFMFSFEPFFLGNSRLFHLDILLSLFMVLALLTNFYGLLVIKEREKKALYWISISGFFAGLSFLTKSIGIGLLLFLPMFTFFYIYKKTTAKQAITHSLTVFLAALACIFVLFPALWVAPIDTLSNIFNEAERVGVRKGHEQVFFGEDTLDAGPLFYLVILLMKLTPVTILGIFLFALTRKFKSMITTLRHFSFSDFDWFSLMLSVFYLGYLIVMIVPTKKLDRYMLPLFPILCFYATLGFWHMFQRIKFYKYSVLVIVLLAMFYILPLISFYPTYFTYYSPVFLNGNIAHSVVAQKPFGMGIYDLKKKLFELYGPYPTLGMIDTKPMQAIYMNSRLYDIRVYGPGKYNVIVLGPNEELTDEILDSKEKFVLRETVKIGGIDFWSIYEKQIN